KGIEKEQDFVENIVALVKERCSFARELWENSDYFFVAPQEYAEKALKKRWKEGTSNRMNEIVAHLETIEDNADFAQTAEDFLMNYIQTNELNMGQIMNSIRLAVVGDTKGPNMLDIMKVLGKQEIIKRIRIASEKINL
ncbi:MAG: glutamate--tRNA ligase, partial [Bacteroidales bacterium]|nr:glutamate--tRNA ligase [Bacteroidales bacterium]